MNSSGQFNSDKEENMEFQSKGKGHPYFGCYVATLPLPTKQEFHSITWEP